MSDANVPIRSVQNPLDPNSASQMLRFFEELRERTGGDTDLLAVVHQQVEVMSRSLPGFGSLRWEARAARFNADAAQVTADLNTARIKELTFLTF